MKVTRWLLVSSILTLTVAQAHAADPLAGAWQFVSGRYTDADGKVTEASAPELRSLKVLSASRFVYITTKKDGEFVRSAGGEYAINGDAYAEKIDASSAEVMRGKTYSFEWRVEGDLWYHTGMKDGVRLEEIWRRVVTPQS
jgi:hypothetical protein